MKRLRGFVKNNYITKKEQYFSHGIAITSSNINLEKSLEEIENIFKVNFNYSITFYYNNNNWSIIGDNYDDYVYNFPKTLSNGTKIIWSTYDIAYFED